MRPDEPQDEFEIDLTPIWPDEDGRLEPIFLPGPLWIDFEDFDPIEMLPALETAAASADSPALIGFGEVELPRYEADDSEPMPEAPPEASLSARRRDPAVGVLGSLGVHLLPLLVLIGWSAAPAGMSGAIPVQLVLEAAAAPANDAPPGEAVAEGVGEAPKSEDAAPVAASPPPTPAPPTPAPPRQLAAAPPPPKQTPPKPKPVAAPTPALPPPTAAPARVAAAAPAPAAAARLAATAAASATASPRPAAAAPATGGGDYLNQLVVLTRGHLNILPASFLAGRRGRTTLSVLVIEDGTIGRISVKRSSGYPDIDARIEQMVAAVGRFPPVPAALPHPSVELDFDMSFPDAVQQ